MGSRRFKLLWTIIVVAIIGVLVAFVGIRFISQPDVTVCIERTNSEDNTESIFTLVYRIRDQYGYRTLKLEDFGLDGTLDKIEYPDGTKIYVTAPVPETITEDSKLTDWATWVTRFEKEIRPKAVHEGQ